MKACLLALLGLCSSSALAQQGAWEQSWFPFGDLDQRPIFVVNLVHVFDSSTGAGKFLAMTYEFPNDPYCSGGYTRLWTPPPVGSDPGYPGRFQTVANCRTTMFCQGHSQLADGSILHAGGLSVRDANLFDPMLAVGPPANPPDPLYSNQWNNPMVPCNMAFKRYYPTCTTLPDGKVLVTSGWWCDQSRPDICPDPWGRSCQPPLHLRAGAVYSTGPRWSWASRRAGGAI